MSEDQMSHQSFIDKAKVSLKQTLEKLFDDEQLNRDEHIQYAIYLLSLIPNDQYLDGLNLDFLDFDLNSQPNQIKPEALIRSQKNRISKTPITWYINSIAQLDESQENALIWNILVLKTAIYLIALPEIRPEIFRKNRTEHFNTVKGLFDRFRIANQVLIVNKKYRNTVEYMGLWDKYLTDPTRSLENFVQYLRDVDSDELSNDFEKNLLKQIRVPFNYVLQKKAKIAKESIRTQLQHEFLDENQLILESSEVQKGQKSKALNVEKQLDDQSTRQIHVNPTVMSPLAQHSEANQSYVHPLVAKHIQRKEHLLLCSSLFPNPASIRALFNQLYDNYTHNKNRKVSLILMLSLLTGNSIQEWLHLQNTRVKALNSRKKIVHIHQQYFLQTKFTIFENKSFAYPQALLNQHVHINIPIPNDFISTLKDGEKVTEEDLKKYLKQLRIQLHIPKLSLIKISSLLHQTILQHTGNKQLADLLTGIDANRSSSISYCHQNTHFLHTEFLSVLQKLSESLCSQYHQIEYNEIYNFGSQKAPACQVIINIFVILKFNIFSQQENDWITIFNHYNIWMWHVLLLFTAARPVAEFPGFLKSFNLKRQICMVSDKEIGGRDGFGRLIPLCNFIVTELKKFIQFLEYFKDQVSFYHPEYKDYFQNILKSERPVLNIIQDGQWQALSPSIVEKFHPELGLEQANWHRHTTRAFLSNKIGEPEILALFGHEPMQQEAAHRYSSLSIAHYSKIAHTLEQMKDHFNITGIELNVLIQ